MRWLRSYWRGELGFWATMICVLGPGVALGLLAVEYDVPQGVAILGTLVIAVLFVWQARGAMRFADRQIVDRNAERAWMIYAAIGFAFFMAVGVVLSLWLPAPPPDLELADQRQRISRDGPVATVLGDIDYRTLTALKRTHAQAPLQIVSFNSPGGQTIAGRSIGIWNVGEGLDTHVDQTCLSACTLAFAGGARRTAGPDARFGFHAARYRAHSQVRVVDPAEVALRNRDFLISRGVAGSFVDRIDATPAVELWEPSRDVLRSEGFLTD